MSKMKIPAPIKTIPNNSKIVWHSYNADIGGCGHIRIIFPSLFCNIEKFNNNIKIMASYSQKYIADPNYYSDLLFVLIQRAATNSQLGFLKYLKTNLLKDKVCKIIYELDDDLIDVPEWNMAADYFNKNRKYSLEIIRNCFGVTTSTEHLAKKLRRYNKNVKVFPNHLLKWQWGEIPLIKPINKKPKILWHGSSNHFALPRSGLNGGDFGNELINFIIKTSDIYDWNFIGAIPKELIEHKDKFSFHQWRTIFEYPLFIKSLNIDIGIAPLAKEEFNRSKSNIKAMEYTAAGIPGIYTNITPYANLKNVCNTDEEMISFVEKMVKDDDFRKQTMEHDYNVHKDYLFWEENNNIKRYIDIYLSFFNLKLPVY